MNILTKIYCPKCQGKNEVENSLLNDPLLCQHCGHEFMATETPGQISAAPVSHFPQPTASRPGTSRLWIVPVIIIAAAIAWPLTGATVACIIAGVGLLAGILLQLSR